MTRAGISFESAMTAEQAGELARLMEAGRSTRPEGVVTALLEYAEGRGRLLVTPRRCRRTSPRRRCRGVSS